ncbi:MAG: hypothetical protein IPJ65_28130 [Archangiaceae bacterium]|nr:hypothetical protein [Archangiaceae bacterium]
MHNAAGNPIETTNPLGETTKIEWTAQQPTRRTDGRGLDTTATYDTKGNLLTRTYPDGRQETNTWEPTFSQPLTQASTGMPTVVNTYDTSGRLKTRNPGLGVTTYNYDAKGQLFTVVEPGPATTTFGHDAVGNVNSVTDATNRATTMGFDSAGHLTSVTDGNAKTRTLEVDAAGRVHAQIDALNRRTEFTFDGEGHRLTTKDAELNVTTFGYDANGRLTSVTDANQKVTRTEYDAEGRVTATIDARGNRSTRKYDAAGRLVETTDASGAVTSQLYCGDVPTPCTEVDALGNVRTREFDAVGRVTHEIDPLGRETAIGHDTAGRVSSEAGPGKPLTTYSYQSATGLLSTVTTPALTVTYQYDARGNRRQVTAGSQVTQYTFDTANRLLTETNPLLKVTTYTYDGAGNRRTKLDANGHTTTYSYDDNRRLGRVDFDDGTFYQYDYDTRGNRTLEKGPSHERHLHYDVLNRLDVVDDLTFGKQLVYGYDASGNRTSLAEGGVTQYWEYDKRNLLAAARVGTGPRTLFGYDTMGRRDFVVRPNGVRTDYAYDESSQLLSMTHSKAGAVLLGFSYAYDGQGNRVSKTREGGTAEVYGYDTSMRLTKVDYGTAKTVEYTLDALGNRLTEVQTVRPASGPNVVTTWSSTFNAFNQLKTRNRSGGGLPALNTTFDYDDIGNTTTETASTAVTSYTWDRDNRLRAVTPLPPAVPTAYSYDTNGFRVGRTEAIGTTRYLLDGQSVRAELDASNTPVARYLFNPQAVDDLISFERADATYWPLTDGLGSIYAASDASGTVVHQYGYEVYGARTELGGSGPSFDVGHAARWHDANGLIEHRDRLRNPLVAGFLQADRLGMRAGPNSYAFAANNPTQYVDPTGRLPDVSGVLSMATIGALLGAAFVYFFNPSCDLRVQDGAVFGAMIGAVAALGLDINVAFKLIRVFGNAVDFQITAYSRLFQFVKLALGWTPGQGWHINFARSGHLFIGPIAQVLILLTVGVMLAVTFAALMAAHIAQIEAVNDE